MTVRMAPKQLLLHRAAPSAPQYVNFRRLDQTGSPAGRLVERRRLQPGPPAGTGSPSRNLPATSSRLRPPAPRRAPPGVLPPRSFRSPPPNRDVCSVPSLSTCPHSPTPVWFRPSGRSTAGGIRGMTAVISMSGGCVRRRNRAAATMARPMQPPDSKMAGRFSAISRRSTGLLGRLREPERRPDRA